MKFFEGHLGLTCIGGKKGPNCVEIPCDFLVNTWNKLLASFNLGRENELGSLMSRRRMDIGVCNHRTHTNPGKEFIKVRTRHVIVVLYLQSVISVTR